ncbi:MAG: hypothetical protein ACOY5V_00130 [Pseudomonadota bacterium]
MERATTSGTLKHGLKIGETVHREFVIREAVMDDYFGAETEATADRPITFRTALLARQLVRIGTFEGPFTLALLGKLHPRDVDRMLAARDALEREGEGEQPG